MVESLKGMLNISFRAVTDADIDFLKQVYFSTRLDELAITGWDKSEIDRFLSQQFSSQHQYYKEQFPHAAFELIQLNDTPIGRLYTDLRADEIRLIDIALLPEHRKKGIGRQIMSQTLQSARSLNLPVRIHVEKNNPALKLYHRLGFTEIEDKGVYSFLQWSPDNIET